MTFTPAVREMQVVEQGGDIFTYPANWVDVIQSSPTHAEYDLTAARSAMGLQPGQPIFVVFSADGPFWANFNANAALPSGNTTDGSSSEYCPNQRYLDKSFTKISVISVANQNISMQFYRP